MCLCPLATVAPTSAFAGATHSLHATQITRTSISLAWSGPRGATFELRRTTGSHPAATRHRGVHVSVYRHSAQDRHLRAGTHYAYALFARIHDHWRPAVTLLVVTKPAMHKTTPASIDNYVVGSDLNCEMYDGADNPSAEFFGNSACGTFLDYKGSTYGPADIPNGDKLNNESFRPWGASTQSTNGSGTTDDPFVTTTTVDGPTSPLSVTQTDRYASGASVVSTTTQVSNTSDADVTVTIYHAFDCFAGGTDLGTGTADTSMGSVSCVSANRSNDGSRRTLQLTPKSSSGSQFVEEYYQDLWGDIAAQRTFPDTVRADVHDTSEGLSWTMTVPANGSVSVQYATSLLNSF